MNMIVMATVLALVLALANGSVHKSSLIVTPDGWRLSGNLSNTTVIVGSKGRRLIGFNNSACDLDHKQVQTSSSTRVIGFDHIPVIDLNGTSHLLTDNIVPVSTLDGDIIYTIPEALSPIDNSTTLISTPTPLDKFRQRSDPQRKIDNETGLIVEDVGRSISNSSNISNSSIRAGPNTINNVSIIAPSSSRISSNAPSSSRMSGNMPSSRTSGNIPSSSRTSGSVSVPSSSRILGGVVPSIPAGDKDLDPIGQLLNEVLNPILTSTSLWNPVPTSSSDMMVIPVDTSDIFQGDIIIETDDQPQDRKSSILPIPVSVPEQLQVHEQLPIGLVSPDQMQSQEPLPIGVASPEQLLIQDQILMGPGPRSRMPVQERLPIGVASPEQIQLQDEMMGPAIPKFPMNSVSQYPISIEDQIIPTVMTSTQVIFDDQLPPKDDVMLMFGPVSPVSNLEIPDHECNSIMI